MRDPDHRESLEQKPRTIRVEHEAAFHFQRSKASCKGSREREHVAIIITSLSSNGGNSEIDPLNEAGGLVFIDKEVRKYPKLGGPRGRRVMTCKPNITLAEWLFKHRERSGLKCSELGERF